MFRHLVVTGRSRLALYLARIPAGLAIVVPLVAVGFTIVCAVCCLRGSDDAQLRRCERACRAFPPGLENWAADHPDEVICNFGIALSPSTPNASEIASVLNSATCNNGPGSSGPVVSGPGSTGAKPTQAEVRAVAILIARQNYSGYTSQFLSPSDSLMIKSGLWLELEALIGFIVGLGLASLLGQRTVSVILMIVLEVILTPIFSRARIPHLLNLQRAVVGVATAHLAPGGISVFGGGGGGAGAEQREPTPHSGVDHRGGLRHHCLASRLDCPWCLADDDQGRLSGEAACARRHSMRIGKGRYSSRDSLFDAARWRGHQLPLP